MVSYNSGLPEAVIGLGLQAATLTDYAVATTAYTLSSGLFVAVLVPLNAGQQFSQLGCVLDTAGVTTSGVTEMSLFSRDGQTRYDKTVDMTAAFGQTPPKAITGALSLGQFTAPTTDLYYLCALTHFSGTAPKIIGSPLASTTAAFAAINSRLPSITFSGQATTPTTFTPSSGSVNSAAYYLFAQ